MRGGGAQPGPRRALIVAGPTASGKSALALALAERLGGAIINADAMQCVRELRVLTARPTPEEEARVPHLLYGVRPAAEPTSVAWWRAEAAAALEAASAQGRLPILCGGTGMYLASLTRGLAAVPEVPEAARAEARALLAALGPGGLHARLAEADPETAARLRPTDSQRIARAFEVWRGTGRGLAAWQREPGLPPLPWAFSAILLDPPRQALREAIARRWEAMIAAGAVEEVRALLALGLDPALPAMRAHGVPEIAAALRGEITLAEAGRRACLAIGQYTKRQATWFRHHPLSPPGRTHSIHARIEGYAQLPESLRAGIESFLRSAVDAPQRGA
ncbi:MAG: tRNA (adenosine(37)-N6)-dimethylallyltransferase MiaA [Acetobacteraceae bacterium]|nr:tRNA (adenosine(37)-N6)-dimethylallyltransferase MiaA [Acetobacteraceae bacterium]